MVNEEILGGLISGLERGESLKKAMISLFNAGYKKEEIEEAARIVNGMDITQIKEKVFSKQMSDPLLNKQPEAKKAQNLQSPELRQLPPLPKIPKSFTETENKKKVLVEEALKEEPSIKKQPPVIYQVNTSPINTPSLNSPTPIRVNVSMPRRDVYIPRPQVNFYSQNQRPRMNIPPQPRPVIIKQQVPQKNNARDLIIPVPVPSPTQSSYPKYNQSAQPIIKNENPSKKVSDYPIKKDKSETLIIVILILLLVFLVGALISIFVFKQEIINFLSSFLN